MSSPLRWGGHHRVTPRPWAWPARAWLLLWLAASWLAPGLRAQGVVDPPEIRANGRLPDSGVFQYLTADPVHITLSAGAEAGEIYYTTDGSDPDPGLPTTFWYSQTGPFDVTPPTIIRAVAESVFFDYSTVAEAQLLFIASYAVTDATVGGGGFTVTPPAADYPSGTRVTLSATNLPGWQFIRWEGDLSGTNPVTSLKVDAAKSVRAVFGTALQTSVNAIAGSAGGTVVLEPVSGPYPFGSLVRLMALPASGRAFTGWTNNPAWTNQQLLTVVVTNANPAFRAVFNTLPSTSGSNTVSLKVSGGGTVVRLPELPRAVYKTGSIVEIRPLPDPDWVFEGWSGDAVGAANPLFLTVTTNRVVTARFSRRVPGEPIIEGLDLAEYFWDVAPLESQGTPIRLEGGNVWIPDPRTLDLSTLAPGLHQLGVRVRDDQRRWSDIVWRAVQVEDAQKLIGDVTEWPDAMPESALSAAEYFWDTDPGRGNGTAVKTDPGSTWTTSAPELPDVNLQGLAPGLHALGFRVRDGAGRWSDVAWSRIVVEDALKLLAGVGLWPETLEGEGLVAAEYFWDADPGQGLGTSMPIDPGFTAQPGSNASVTVESLPPGLHQLGWRVRDTRGRWSTPTWNRIRIEVGDDLLSGVEDWPSTKDDDRLVAAEYFWDTDPGPGAALPLAIPAAHSLITGADDTASIALDVPPLSLGYHRLGLRVQDGRARWSDTVHRHFTVERNVGLATLPGSGVTPGTNRLAVVAVGEETSAGTLEVLGAGDGVGVRLYSAGSPLLSWTESPAFFRIDSVSTAVWGDFDNDGSPDLALGMESAVDDGLRLFTRRQSDPFEAVAADVIPTGVGSVRCLAWSDIDRDGFLDLLVVSPSSPSLVILENRAGTRFERRQSTPSVGGPDGRSIAATDVTGDGYPDLIWIGSDGLHLYRNRAGQDFEEVAVPALVDPEAAVGAMAFDPDNDGDMDLLVVSGTRGAELLRNNGGGIMARDDAAGLTIEGRAATSAVATDLDGDGWLDVVVTTTSGGPVLFRNLRNGTFSPSDLPIGAEETTRIAVADVDRSGAPDLILAGPGDQMQSITNSLPGTHWLRVRPRSVNSNRAAIGARVTVIASVDQRLLTQTREITAGNGFGGQDERIPWFGLGDAPRVDLLRVEWPSGLKTEQRDVPVDGTVWVDELPEGSPVVRIEGQPFHADDVYEFVTRNEVAVTVTSKFRNAQIHYSLDGFPADIRSAKYTGPFKVTPPVVIRATAYSDGYLDYAEAQPVRLVFVPSYPVLAGSDGGGRVEVVPALSQYPSNSVVQLSAIAAPGWTFLRWEGDAGGVSSTRSVTMDSPKNVRAVFGTTLTTTVTGGSANGSIVVEPTAQYHAFGSLVRLSAVAATGKGFEVWNANQTLTNGLLTVQITNANPTYNAIFVALRSDQRSLTLRTSGRGTILANPARGTLPAGSVVALNAVADDEWAFDGWSGDVTGNMPSKSITLTANASVTANFRRIVLQTPPSITQQPADANLIAGQSLDLRVAVVGSTPLNYQWNYSGNPIPGAVNPVLSLPSVREINSGGYSVVVWNDFGSITSRLAQVAVARPPNRPPFAALRSPASGMVFADGTPITFTAWAVDPDGLIDRVEFFVNNTRTGFGTPADLPDTYSVPWTNPMAGTNSFYCVAYDREGASVSTVTNTFVLQPPDATRFVMAEGTILTAETNASVVVRVRKNGPAAGSVNYTTRSRTAVLGRDYREASGTLVFNGNDPEQSIRIELLDEFVPDGLREFDVILVDASAGTQLGTLTRTAVSIRDNDGDLNTASLLDFLLSAARPGTPGSLRVSMDPPGTQAEWRFSWENGWRSTGSVATNLDAGLYTVEFRPSAAFTTPAPSRVLITNGQSAAIVVGTTPRSDITQGGIVVALANDPAEFPVALGGWRFVGETGYHEFGSNPVSRPPGDDFIEFRSVDGWIEPPATRVTIQASLTIESLQAYTRMPTKPAGASPMVAYSRYDIMRNTQVSTPKTPSPMVGQLRTPAGFGSGIAVRQRVVLTAAHVLFDESNGQFVPPESVQWFHERIAGDSGYEPVPIKAAGYYIHEGYMAARNSERQQPGWKPGTVTPTSQEWDVAAIFFNEPVARGGQAGYLLANDSPGQWLNSGGNSQLMGYPFGTGPDGVGRMHHTESANNSFDAIEGAPHVLATPQIYGLPGASGGPLLVSNGSAYFPAAVYLGNLGGQAVFRVIDASVASMINRAASSALLGINFNFGGPIQSVVGLGEQLRFGVIQFQFQPQSIAAAAGWRVSSQGNSAFAASGQNIRLPSATYTAEFRPVAGIETPPNVSFILDPSTTINNPLVVRVNYGTSPKQTLALAPVDPQQIDEDAPFQLQLEAQGDPAITARAQFKLVDGPADMTVTSQGRITWPPNEFHGPSTNMIRVAVSDGTTGATNSFVLVVNEVNTPPVFVGLTNATVAIGTLYQQTLAATDTDHPRQTLVFRWVGGPLGSGVTNGVFGWIPDPTRTDSTNEVLVAVGDGTVNVTNRFLLTVPPPAITLELTGVRLDPDSPSLLFSIRGTAGSTVDLESSPDFETWNPVQRVVLPRGDLPVLLPIPTDAANGFYRARIFKP